MNPPRIGTLPSGPRDAISDVGEIRVGHVTLDRGAVQTGVTVVVPHAGDPFADKVPAASAVINGFGKSVGLIQVEELGVFETPIALTNTFGVGAVMQAQIRAAMAAHPRLGREWATVNPLVFDGYPSIGCEPCTRPVAPGEDIRAGRWAGSAKTECGIHL